jgi:hypothetical protein
LVTANDPLDLDLAMQAANTSGAAQGRKFALIHESRAESIRARFSNVHVVPYGDHEDVPRILAALSRHAPR